MKISSMKPKPWSQGVFKFLHAGFAAATGAAMIAIALASIAKASPAREMPIPPGLPADERGGGGQPDPLAFFNMHAELADGDFYLLKGVITLTPVTPQSFSGGSRKQQPYFNVDLKAHAWLAGEKRRASPMYLIEAPLSIWRHYAGSYGELAAQAHVQLMIDGDGTPTQVISLRPIPELSRF